jgi:CYTH domain-containing protein
MIEIERKFLVDTNLWCPKDSGNLIVQGYLSTDKERVVRVRIKGERAFLTIKALASETFQKIKKSALHSTKYVAKKEINRKISLSQKPILFA